MDIALLILLLVPLLVLLVTVIHSLYTGIPIVPTSSAMTEELIRMHQWNGNETVYDLGAGDGRVLERVKKMYPGVHAKGCEIVPAVFLLGKLRALFFRSGVELSLGSMFQQDLHDADVVMLYLFPSYMERLQKQFDAQLKPGTVVLTHTFGFPDKTPVHTKRFRHLGGEVSVFLYRW